MLQIGLGWNALGKGFRMKTLSEKFLAMKDHVDKISDNLKDKNFINASYLLGYLNAKCYEFSVMYETQEEKQERENGGK